MAENGTATFADPDDYKAGIDGARVNLIVTGGAVSACFVLPKIRRALPFSRCRRRRCLFRFQRAPVRP